MSIKVMKNLLKNKKLVILVVGILIVGFVVYKLFGSKSSAPQFQTGTVVKGDIVVSVSASGQITSSDTVSVTTQASGVISKIYVADGQEVKKGDKILEVTLDSSGEQKNSSAWAAYQSAENSLDSAQIAKTSAQATLFSNWDTFNKLAQTGLYQNSDGTPRNDERSLAEFHIAQDNWLASEAKYKQQDELIAQIQTSLNNAWVSYQQTSPTVYASADGVISSFTVTEGSMVNSSLSSSSTVSTNSSSAQRIAVIQNETLPLGTFNISEVDVPKVKIGQKAVITLDSIADKTFTGRVMTVDKVGSVSSNVTNYSAIIKFDSKVAEILPNMSASAKIVTTVAGDALYVPAAAVTTSNGVSSVQVMKNGQPVATQVELGISNDTQVEIKSGLSEGDTVVTGPVAQAATSTAGTRSIFSGFGGGGGGGGTTIRRGN
jgi:membrane fusion protein, macrolide-specific efflux system